MVGLLILVCTSIPTALAHGAGLGGFIVAILVVGVGTGGIKSNVAPLVSSVLGFALLLIVLWKGKETNSDRSRTSTDARKWPSPPPKKENA